MIFCNWIVINDDASVIQRIKNSLALINSVISKLTLNMIWVKNMLWIKSTIELIVYIVQSGKQHLSKDTVWETTLQLRYNLGNKIAFKIWETKFFAVSITENYGKKHKENMISVFLS